MKTLINYLLKNIHQMKALINYPLKNIRQTKVLITNPKKKILISKNINKKFRNKQYMNYNYQLKIRAMKIFKNYRIPNNNQLRKLKNLNQKVKPPTTMWALKLPSVYALKIQMKIPRRLILFHIDWRQKWTAFYRIHSVLEVQIHH